MHVQLNFTVEPGETIVGAILKKLGLPLTMQAPALPPTGPIEIPGIDRTPMPFWKNATEVDLEKPVEPPKRRGRPPKGAASEPEVVEPTAMAPEAITPAETAMKVHKALDLDTPAGMSAANETTMADVRSVIEQAAGMEGIGVGGVKAILNDFGVDKANKLDPSKWAEFVAAVRTKMSA